MQQNAKEVAAEIKSNVASLTGKIAAARQAANSGIAAANAASGKRYQAALSEITGQLQAAEKKSVKKFGTLYEKMGKDRKDFEQKVANSFVELNEALAQQAAIQNKQFTKDLP